MKPEHSKMEYVRLTMEEYQALVEENKKLKEYLELAIADMTNFAEESCDDCKNNACRFCAGCMQVNNYDCYFRWGRFAEVKDMINLKNAEIIETQPVRHGEWKEEVAHKEWAGLLPNAWEEEATIHNGNTSDYDCWCSECHSKGLHHWGYCCVCGAKMDKEELK